MHQDRVKGDDAMCRYAFHEYKPHFACFACRKGFKRRLKHDVDPLGEDQPALCPQCRGPMADMGLDFAPPKRADLKAWRAAEVLFEVGETFHSCGCGGIGLRPRDPAKLAAFFDERERVYRQHLTGWLKSAEHPDRDKAIAVWRRRIARLAVVRAKM